MPLAAFLKQVSDNTQLSAFEIIQSDLPDLQIADTSVKTIPAAEIFTRQELKVIYRVNNLGVATDDDSVWTDAIYFSPGSDLIISEAIKMKEIIHYGKLQQGDSYVDTISIIIPKDMVANYYVHVKQT